MAKSKSLWKRGRGKLGAFAPLIGAWTTSANTPMGPVVCTRTFTSILNNSYIRLVARWEFEKSAYEEIAMIGIDRQGEIAFWSFTSDGKNSQGKLTDATDVHPE